MSVTVPKQTEITIGDVHELDSDEFVELRLMVSRRHEPGAGQFHGMCLLSPEETEIPVFRRKDELLTFIDDLQSHGLITAVGKQMGSEDPSLSAIISHLHIGNPKQAGVELIEAAGMNNPMNLCLTVYKETHEQSKSKHCDNCCAG